MNNNSNKTRFDLSATLICAATLVLALSGTARAGKVTYLPVIAYQPETSLILGAGATMAFGDSSASELYRPDNAAIFAMYTLKNQFILAFAPDFYFGERDEWQLKINSSYKKFPDSFFGLGDNTSEEDEETYTTESVELESIILRRLFAGFSLGMRLRYARSGMIEREDGGFLEQDRSGESTIPGNGSWRNLGAGVVLDWDTRDNIFASYTGSWYQLRSTHYRDDLGSEFDYDYYELDLRRFQQLKPRHVVALLLYGEHREGTVPFTNQGHLGKMPGIVEGRFRDMAMGLARIDYRFPLDGARPFGWRLPFQDRMSGALFAAVGGVAPKIGEIMDADQKYSFGFGLRWTIDKGTRMRIRFDMGFSEFGAYPYFQINESF